MPDKRSILIMLDPDAQTSSFDRVVATDAGVDQQFAYANVAPDQVQGLVHGAIFTRGMDDLKRTAIFVGGSDVEAGEKLLARVTETFFGPMRVSVMFDANGANTTAAAAVLAAGKHVELSSASSPTALVLAGTGPVGQRAARLLAREGVAVRLASRSLQRATAAANAINKTIGNSLVTGIETRTDDSLKQALDGVAIVIAAGAAGIRLLATNIRETAADLRVAIDLNAVPPLGIEGIDVTDKAKAIPHAASSTGTIIGYGAIGVGGTKMKIHKAALRSLFESNDKVLDAEAIYQIGKSL